MLLGVYSVQYTENRGLNVMAKSQACSKANEISNTKSNDNI